jgi:hypothetical protein
LTTVRWRDNKTRLFFGNESLLNAVFVCGGVFGGGRGVPVGATVARSFLGAAQTFDDEKRHV